MIQRILVVVALLAGLAAAQSAIAQTAPVANLGFKLGDDVATVKAALSTNAEPEPMLKSPLLPANVPDLNRGKTVLHLRTKGIWVFFDTNGSAETIRLDAPFNGDVLGVKLGETTKQVIKKLGNPIKKPGAAFGALQTYRYVIDDSAYVTYDTNDDGVQMIFISK